jgi:SPX domain protein involved in polyphosphate accumulation
MFFRISISTAHPFTRAQLHRLRWYGDAQSLPDKDYIFMERKTHHESWVDLKSVKERFPLKTRRVADYLNGSFDATEAMQKWMKPDRDGVRLIKTDAELEKANQLCAEVQRTVAEQKLQPMIRTVYRRAAFQVRCYSHNTN